MTLLNRIYRLFKADVHGILDCLEVPEMVLKQAIRDMQDEISKGEARLKELEKTTENSRANKESVLRTLEEIKDQINLCFDAGNEDLGKSFIRKKLETERRLNQMELVVDTLEGEKKEVEKKLSEQQEQLDGIIQKMELYEEQTRASRLGAEVAVESGLESWGSRVSDEEVEIAFLAEKQKREHDSEGPRV